MKFTKDLDKTTTITQKDFKETVKFRLNEDGIFINAKLNDEKNARELAFDTFADNWISEDTKNDLKVKSKKLINGKGGVDGIGRVGMTYISTTIGNIDFQKIPYMVMENEGPGYEALANGVIGVSLMQSFIWALNFNDSTLTITDRLDYLNEYTNEYKINFIPRSSQKTPLFKFIINEVDTIDAIVDTGNDGFITLPSKFDIKKIKEINPNSIATLVKNKSKLQHKQVKDSIIETSYVKLNSLKIGDYELKDVVAFKSNDWEYGVIGTKFLKNFIVTIDWYNNNIYLKPIAGNEISTNLSTYGFECYLYYNKIIVSSIFKNSLAEKLGLQSGDEIGIVEGLGIKDSNKKTTFLINEGKLAEEIGIKIKANNSIIHLKKYNAFN